MKGKTTILAAVILLAGAAKAYCGAPNLMTYQGRLKESGVQASGPRSVEIKLCPDETGNDASCQSTGPQQVTVANGLFRSTFTVPSSVDMTTGVWYLELWVGTGKFSPRERLSSVAYSIYATSASALTAAPDTTGIFVSSSLFVTAGNVGIGTTGPATMLDVNGSAQFGSGTAKSTFTAAGALNLAANQNITFSGTGKATGLAAPTADSDAANKQYVDNDTNSCPTGMAYIPGPYPYCVDKYEAYLAGGTVTNCACTNGSQAEVDACASTAVAGSAAGQTPLVSINWCAARKACANAGKHLLTNSEWFNAANYKGSKWNITAEETAETMACNTAGGAANTTGASAGCVTQEGVYDMIGNVWEWVDFVMTADPTNGLASNYVTGYDFATGIPTSVGATTNAYGNDYYWAYTGVGAARAVVRGGIWGLGADAGVFAFSASYAPSDWGGSIGFRCGRRK